MNDGIIRNAFGAIISIKVIDTGMKVINKQRDKVKKDKMFDMLNYKKKKFL